ncbi:DUF4041 domain-containing protein [Clostridium sp. HMSC19A10]|uniref:DUF4041 domain-containing protein n=1 Tax=Clostridium sp. HMSC19A10 TaxID=1581148 RepID=UPI0008A598FC|nr:DUF4041 domain-containing protein [Clostridium sp. HMSC19A10]OFS23477.1 hypothetical protein HMPREF3070_08395 [Clostridium sp. HMSC19A10]
MGFDLFNKKKVESLQNQVTELEEKLKQLELTKEEAKYLDLKKELTSLENTILNKSLLLENINNEINAKNDELDALSTKVSEKCNSLKLLNTIDALNIEIASKKAYLNYIEEDDMYQSFGLYKPKYNLMDSEEYKQKLLDIRDNQKLQIKNKSAVNYSDNWTLDGSKSKGRAMNNDNIKMIIRSFNNECEACINKIKFNNIENIRKRIVKSFEALNKLNQRNQISITDNYLDLKLKELDLAYEYELKKQEEKEEQQRIKEQMREEAKVLKEIENAKKKLEKEESHFRNAINDIKVQLNICNENDKAKLENKLDELNAELDKLEKDKLNIENREKNTRAGYVYVISNIGSFGDDVYKIGMTRRLEPTERIRELGSASVPFNFDIHAIIFSDDAPALENALHREFADNSVNQVNMRKEFFKIPLSEIERVVKENYNEIVQFTKIAEAAEYRQSLAISKKSQHIA